MSTGNGIGRKNISRFYDKSVSSISENGRTITLPELVIPKFFELIFVLLLGTVNTIMLSSYSSDAVAATSVAGQIFTFICLFPSIIATGSRVLLSIAIGSKDPLREKKIIGTSLLSCIFFALALGVIGALTSLKLVNFMNLTGETANTGASFLSIKLIFLPITAVMSCLNQILLCYGYAKQTLAVGILSNLLNALFGYIVLYSNIALPVDGVCGVAYGSVLAQAIALLLALYFCKKYKCIKNTSFDKTLIAKIFKIGLPGSMNIILYTLAQLVTTSFVVSFGIDSLNAKVYITNIVGYTSQLSLAIGQGGGIIIGRYKGSFEFDKADVLHKQNIKIAALCNASLSILAFIFHIPLLSMFTDNQTVIALAGTVMLIDIIIEIARAINHVSEASLIANGDVKTTFIASFISCWAFSVLFAYLFGIKLSGGLIGCWIAFALDEIFKNIVYFIRWKNGKWKNIEV